MAGTAAARCGLGGWTAAVWRGKALVSRTAAVVLRKPMVSRRCRGVARMPWSPRADEVLIGTVAETSSLARRRALTCHLDDSASPCTDPASRPSTAQIRHASSRLASSLLSPFVLAPVFAPRAVCIGCSAHRVLAPFALAALHVGFSRRLHWLLCTPNISASRTARRIAPIGFSAPHGFSRLSDHRTSQLVAPPVDKRRRRHPSINADAVTRR